MEADTPPHIVEAKRAFDAEDYVEVERVLHDHVERGDVDTLDLLGLCLFLAGPDRWEEAAQLLSRAAAAGCSSTAHNLGTLYMAGGTPDYEKARACYRRAYELGFEQKVASDPLWWERIGEGGVCRR